MATGEATQGAPPQNPPSANIQTLPPAVKFNVDTVPPSQYLYLQSNDALGLTVLSNFSGTPLLMRYRYLNPQGQIKEGQFQVILNAGVQQFTIPFQEGWLLSVGFQCGTPFATNNWCFVHLELLRGAGVQALFAPFGTIWEGYVGFQVGSGWPGTPSQRIFDGAGTLRSIVGTTPAAGAEILETVPSNRRWNLIGFRIILATSATVANRNVTFRLVDASGNQYFVGNSYANQGATTTSNYSVTSFNQQSPQLFGDTPLAMPTSVLLKAGMRIQTLTNNLQAGDQYSAPIYLVQEWGDWDNT